MPARYRRRAQQLVLALASTGLAAASAPAASPPTGNRHDDVRALAKPHCGSCHQSSLPTAKPAALAIFDLDRERWADTMTKKQRECFLGRIKGKLDGQELAKVRAFVADERPR